MAITEYYTGTRWGPVKSISRSSQTGHATNIIEGLAVGMQATALPVIVIAIGIVAAYKVSGNSLYGIGVARRDYQKPSCVSHGAWIPRRGLHAAKPARTIG